MRAPIVSYKHQRQEDITYIGTGANNFYTVYTGTGPGSTATPDTVPAGNKVFSVNVSLNYINPEGSGTATINWMIIHLRADQNINTLFAATDASNWTNIGLSLARNQVLKSFLSLVGSEDAGPKLWNVHIKIPKMWQRVREGDSIVIVFNSVTAGPLSTGTRFKSFS